AAASSDSGSDTFPPNCDQPQLPAQQAAPPERRPVIVAVRRFALADTSLARVPAASRCNRVLPQTPPSYVPPTGAFAARVRGPAGSDQIEPWPSSDWPNGSPRTDLSANRSTGPATHSRLA